MSHEFIIYAVDCDAKPRY